MPDSPRAVVALVHGMGEHCGRYEKLAGRFNQTGLGLVSADLRGHGRSGGEPCYVRTFDRYVLDARAILMKARELAQDKPLFLMGHSMGGAITMQLLEHMPEWRSALKGVIFSSPALRIGTGIPPLLLRLLPFVAAVAPRLRVKPLDPRLISRDAAEVAAYAADPLVAHRPPPLRTVLELLQAIHNFSAAATHMQLPMLVFHGDADGLTDVGGSRELYAQWGGSDKTLHVWPGGFHELLNDHEREAVTAELVEWIVARS